MNRPFKFRIWDGVGWSIPNGEFGERQPWTMLSCYGEVIAGDNMGAYVISDQNSYIIQQYTGLTDIEGKEIFEGDILLCPDRTNNLYVEVSFNAQQAAFLFENRFAAVDFLKYNRVRVVGNIFENKDLLK